MFRKQDEQGERTERLVEARVERMDSGGGREGEIVGRRGVCSCTEDLYYFPVAAALKHTFPRPS